MNHISDLQNGKGFLNLKVQILLFLRKNNGNKEVIYPDLLARKFDRTKGAVSQSLKSLKSQGLVNIQNYNGQNHHKYRKIIKLTKKGLLFTAQLLFKGLNEIEIKAIKALNLKF